VTDGTVQRNPTNDAGPAGADLARREISAPDSGNDHVGALAARGGSLDANSRAAADHDDPLADQFWLPASRNWTWVWCRDSSSARKGE